MKTVYKEIEKNIDYIKKANNKNEDLIVRQIFSGRKKIAIIFINEQTCEEKIEKYAIEPILKSKHTAKDVADLQQKIIAVSETQTIKNLDDCVSEIMKGNCAIFLNGDNSCLLCITLAPSNRNVVEPPTGAVIYGPREGFIESIKTNLSLIRKRLPTTSLRIEEMHVGRYTKTKIALCYIDDIADNYVVKKIKQRLEKIDIDGIIDSHYLISFLEERKGSVFKQVGKTEKPDVAVAKMLEGRVAILVDASPVVLTLPFVIFEDLQNSDDYYQRSFRVGMVRIMRLIGLLFSILLPGVYVAIQLYHYRIIPIKLLVSIINSTQGIPFTPFLEMLFVIVLFEILFEASLRMPKYIGVAISIVGALVLGDTAVKAGLISSPAVLIIALTGISFYTIPDETSQIRVLRFLFTLIGGTIGLLGLIIGGLMLVTYLVEFNAYGSPYLAPYAPYIKNDIKDGILKKETVVLNTRPQSIPNKKITRELPKE